MSRNLRRTRYHVRRGHEIAGPVQHLRTRRLVIRAHQLYITSMGMVAGRIFHLNPYRPRWFEVEA